MSIATAAAPPLTRRRRAARTVAAALRGGLIGTLVAGAAWLLAGSLAGTAYVFLVIATLAVAAVVVWRGGMANWIWMALAIGWAVVLIERAVVQENGGVWVAVAAWLGVIVGARRAGIGKWALPLLAYPLISVVIVVLAGEDVLDPWGVSWLWVAAVLGPVLAARTLLDPSPRSTPPSKAP